MMANKEIKIILKNLGLTSRQKGCSNGEKWFSSGGTLKSFSPVDNSLIGEVQMANKSDYNIVIKDAKKAFKSFTKIPAPKRGELVRQLGNSLRKNKSDLGALNG